MFPSCHVTSTEAHESKPWTPDHFQPLLCLSQQNFATKSLIFFIDVFTHSFYFPTVISCVFTDDASEKQVKS